MSVDDPRVTGDHLAFSRCQSMSIRGHDRPTVTRVYQNHSLDSTRWRLYRPRPGDIVVASSYKSGTTWVQFIVLRLVRPADRVPVITQLSPWFESPLVPDHVVLEILRHQDHRRVIKTHLPLDGLPCHDEVQYIVVARDPRDVFMSLWNHYRHLVRLPFVRAPQHAGRVGGPLPRCPNEARAFWHDWTTRGWFDWESEGYPFWSNLRHAMTWWTWRHLPNVLFIHYNDLLEDLAGQVASIARFLGVESDEAQRRTLVADAGFASLRRMANELLPEASSMFAGGAATFIYKGTNGRWADVLTEEDLARYSRVVERELSPSCARWLQRP